MAATAPKDPLVGTKLGNCRVERKLGSGGMGAVYLAHHDGLNKSVAIKVLARELTGNEEFIQRFLREARTAARLEHPNVVQVFDVGESATGYYITMQYVDGRSLDLILKERGKLPVKDAIAIVKRVALALAAAHKAGVIHRDIKPANILLSKDGLVKVADFGLARESNSGQTISQTGQIVGTPDYMSPEQAMGTKVDARSDLYSLGATFYHLVTGKKCFQGTTPLSIVIKHAKDEPVPADQADPSVPAAVARIISRMMAKDPALRHPDAESVVRDLDGLKGQTVASMTAPSSTAGAPRSKTLLVLLPAAAVVVAAAVIGYLVFGRKAGPAVAQIPPVEEPKKEEPRREEPKKEEPKPKTPEELKTERLGRIKTGRDRMETAWVDELEDRFNGLMKAVKSRDLKEVEKYMDKQGVKDMTKEQWAFFEKNILKSNADVEIEWAEMQGVTFGPRKPMRPMEADLEFSMKGKNKQSGAGFSYTNLSLHWVKRPDGWYLSRK